MPTDTDVIPVAPSLTPSLRETLSSLTDEDRAAFALSAAEWRRRGAEEARRGHYSTAGTFYAVARVAEYVSQGGER